jgi:hypothetical protein
MAWFDPYRTFTATNKKNGREFAKSDVHDVING